jgi:hypothetical protein
VSIDIDREELISFTAATKVCKSRPHVATVWRWSTIGCHGVVLDSIVIGGRRFTSKEALERFISATDARAKGEPLPTRTPKQRQRSIAAAEKILEAAGI